MPNSREREEIGLRFHEQTEYARTHLAEANYRDFIAGMRDGTTEGAGPLL